MTDQSQTSNWPTVPAVPAPDMAIGQCANKSLHVCTALQLKHRRKLNFLWSGRRRRRAEWVVGSNWNVTLPT